MYFVATDQTVNQLWVVANGQWTSISLMAAAQTTARVGSGSNLVVIDGFLYFVGSDGAVDEMYIVNGQWVLANLMAAAQTTARVASGTYLTVVGGIIYFIGTDQAIDQIFWSTTGQPLVANLMTGSGTLERVDLTYFTEYVYFNNQVLAIER